MQGSLRLIAKPPTAGQIEIWTGLSGVGNAPPALSWTLSGQPLHPAGTLADPFVGTAFDGGRVWIGRFSFPQLLLTRSTTLHCKANTLPEPLSASIGLRPPPQHDEEITILLGSCHHAASAEDLRIEHAANLLFGFTADGSRAGPNLSVFAGDQVYLDLSGKGGFDSDFFENYPQDYAGLLNRLHRHYRSTWFERAGYGRLLGLGASCFMADDHEFWNNAPYRAPWLQNTYTQHGRANWAKVSLALFDAYQETPAYRHSRRSDLAWVSVYCLDTRIGRVLKDNGDNTLPNGALAALKAWVASLKEDQVAVVVTGQSLFQKGQNWLFEKVKDAELPDFDEYEDIVETLLQVPCPLLCLTGDVHYGRATSALRKKKPNGPPVLEVISSPIGLLGKPGRDQPVSLDDRAVDAEPWFWSQLQPQVLPLDRATQRYRSQSNQVCLLRFRRIGGKPRVEAEYWKLDGSSKASYRVPLLN